MTLSGATQRVISAERTGLGRYPGKGAQTFCPEHRISQIK